MVLAQLAQHSFADAAVLKFWPSGVGTSTVPVKLSRSNSVLSPRVCAVKLDAACMLRSGECQMHILSTLVRLRAATSNTRADCPLVCVRRQVSDIIVAGVDVGVSAGICLAATLCV